MYGEHGDDYKGYFFSENGGTKAVAVDKLARLLQGFLTHHHKLGIGTKEFTKHAIRKTMKTLLAEIGIPELYADLLSGHKPEAVLGDVKSRYNKASYHMQLLLTLINLELHLCEHAGVTPPSYHPAYIEKALAIRVFDAELANLPLLIK